MSEELPSIYSRRIHAIDFIRGLMILCMIFVHLLMFLSQYYTLDTPLGSIMYGFYTHFGPVVGPFFFIVSGMSVTIATLKRRRKNVPEAEIRNHILKRGALVILAGYCYSFMRIFWLIPGKPVTLFKFLLFWDLLHSLGFLMILTYLCLKLSIRQRIMLLMGLLVAMTVMSYVPISLGFPAYSPFEYLWLGKDYYTNEAFLGWFFLNQGNIGMVFLDFVFQITWLGTYPIMPWIFFTIFGSIMASAVLEFTEKRDHHSIRKYYFYPFPFIIIALGFGMMIMGAIITTILSLPTHLDSVAYCLTTSGGTMMTFYGVYNLMDYRGKESKIFASMEPSGGLPLTMYMLHGVIIGIIFGGINNVIGIQNIFYFPFDLIIAFSITFGFVVMAYVWKPRKNKYSLDWLFAQIS